MRHNKPLASQLAHRIFFVYLALAISLTLLQIYIEYRNTYSAISVELDATAHAVESEVADAIWNIQQASLTSIAKKMMNGSPITSVKIDSVDRRFNVTEVKNSFAKSVEKMSPLASFNISKTIPLFHTFSDGTRLPIGAMTVCSNHAIVIERAKFSILLMLIAFTVTTVGLWLIIVFFTNRVLTTPLRYFTEQINSINFIENFADATQASQIDIGLAPCMELVDLRESFCEIAATVDRKKRAMQKESAEAVKRANSKFLAAASHDLRQPMHALNLYLASFAELDTSRPIQACVDNLNKCTKAMTDMLDTLLDISNIDAGATQASFNIFPIASPIDRIQAEFEPLAHAKGLTLRIARCSAFVYTDEEIVERILRLLVSNAIRYTEYGKVLIGCRRRNDQLRLTVYDTGPGIALDKQQAIFEEHFQLNNDERNRAKGLGLGLTIVQRLAKLLETSITLDSMPGIGSVFAIDLPLIDLNEIQPITSMLKTELETGPNYQLPTDATIVVIDDEPLILDATRTLLESWGYIVITAMNGQEALAQLVKRQHPPDMIICDYLLEGGEKGMNVISTLRNVFNKEIPAFFVTGITSPDHIETMRASGLAYMYKPLDREKLRDALFQIIPLNYVQ